MPHLRPYAPKDWSRFVELELETQLDSLGDSTEQERDIFKERFTALLDVKMGFSRNGFRRPGARTLQVTTLGIVREARGKNYGRLLMHKAEQEAKERSIEVIALEVAGNNRRARDLFRDLGYETIRRTMHKRLRPQ